MAWLFLYFFKTVFLEQVDVIITDGVGPTSLGVDGRDCAILFPLELFALLNPETKV
jgi:hypothetical protein